MMFKFSDWLDSWFNMPTTLERIMAKQVDLDAKLDQLQAALDAEQEAIRTAIEGLTAEINTLRTEGSVSEASLTRLDEIVADLQGTIEDTPAPTEPTEPPQ